MTTTAARPTIVWFRQDLRIADHPALAHAAARGTVVPVFVLDDSIALGGASRWWLHHSLRQLRTALGGMVLLRGRPAAVLPQLAQQIAAQSVVWNRCYEPQSRAAEKDLREALGSKGIACEDFPGSLLWEPGRIRTLGGQPFKVFTPFWRACLKVPVSQCTDVPRLKLHAAANTLGEPLDDWQLIPKAPNWATQIDATWLPGERGAHQRLKTFLDESLLGYDELRNRPDESGVSRLSPHLHFGEISPRQIWFEVNALVHRDADFRADADKFLMELGWREFSYQLLFEYPGLPDTNWRREFDQYPWNSDAKLLKAWEQGRTGYPLVDAGMRELWQTGYMHNRVRMVVASFLIKHLRIDWRQGASWFFDTLVDADLANNSASWQWVAGSGADAAPYFRIFNPIEQGRKFDPRGVYVRRWCPELAGLPDEQIHAPFEAPPIILQAADVELGSNYPAPIVEHRAARAAALAGYQKVRSSGAGAP